MDNEMKYIYADLLRKEVEKRMHICDGVFERDSDTYYQGKAVAYQETLSFIDSLQQEQSSEDLEKEIDVCWQNWLSPSNQKEVEGVLPKTEFTMYARHFYELGKNSK